MFIWGGVGSSGVNLNDGARYVPTAGGWQAPQTIDDSFDNASSSSLPKVAMDAAGKATPVEPGQVANTLTLSFQYRLVR